jgi:GntR family transcriptional regulator
MSRDTGNQPSGRLLPLHARIREAVRGQIFDGRYRPNDRLPSEKELMSSFAVSRITVRQAMGELEKEGAIYRIAGKGSYVAKPAPVQDLTRLQGFGEAMSRLGYETLNEVIGMGAMAAPADVARQLAVPAGASVTEIRRVRYVDREPVSLDVTYVATELGERLAREDLATRDIFAILELDFGIALGHADLSISTLAAVAPLTSHLKVKAGAPILYLERLTHSREGVPLEFDRIYYRGDSFSYRLRIARD